MEQFKKFLISFFCSIVLAAIVFTFWMRDRYVVPILMYHNVAADNDPGLLNNVTPTAFAWQMKFIQKHGYHVISLDDLVEGINKGRAFARNTVVITFDDGYEDNYTNAFPVLKSYGFPATVFLISDEMGKQGFLTWEQIGKMDAAGFAAGAHTRRHAYLPEISIEQAKDEIAGSKKTIEEHLGHNVGYFSYPSGGFSDEVKGLTQQAGFKAAVSTNRGKDPFNRDLFELKRIRIKDSDSSFVMWAKLSGYYNVFRAPKSGGKRCKTD